MNRIPATLLLLTLAATSACSIIPDEAYSSRGGPESLVDVSRERVAMPVTGKRSLDELADWLNKDQPTRAEVSCKRTAKDCKEAISTLKQFGVPVVYKGEGGGVKLMYERVVARDCDQRFMSNHINPYNLNHPSYGCAMAANAVQMISDRQQIVNPATMGNADGLKTTQVIDLYMRPPREQEFQSLVKSSGSGS